MTSQETSTATRSQGQGFTWILDHLLTYPGTYELPLRTMYTLNSASPAQPTPMSPTSVVGNAFPSPNSDDPATMSTATAAAQLRANLMTHIAQQPSQPTSLPPSFITTFVQKCFAAELSKVDFPQALTALDYLKDLEVRRRNEVVAALDKLGVDRKDFHDRELLVEKYPGVLEWIDNMEEKEKRVEALYTHVYLGLRRWTLINEMSLMPFNKRNCFAMSNTLYPPQLLAGSQFVQPTAQLTAELLKKQRQQFLRYIAAVESKGPSILASLMSQNARPGESTGWPKVRDDLDKYLRTANNVIDECLEITGRSVSPRSATFSTAEEEEQKRKVDSGISFGSGYSSQRSSGQSHVTRPSTSSSVSGHSRHGSREKHERKISTNTVEEEDTITVKPAGSALERIAREIRKIGSRSNIRDESRARPGTSHTSHEVPIPEPESPPPASGRGLRFKRSLKNMRSSSRIRSASQSRPASRNGSHGHIEDVPAFDVDEMKRQREAYEMRGRQG